MSAFLRVLSILGTRPEAIKMAPVIHHLAQQHDIVSAVCLTAQHREMLDQVMNLFDFQADYDLDLMKPEQTLPQLTAEVFTHLDPVLASFQPDWLLVQGDTTSVMAASLCAFYRQIKVGHVEAGLRTHDKWQPFPEEINRRIASVVADLHFAPTELSRNNLLAEGVDPAIIHVTGNTIVDAIQQMARRGMPPDVSRILRDSRVDGSNRKLILVTAHRRENLGKPLEDICQAINRLSEYYGPRLRFVYPVHLNPRVQESVYRLLGMNPQVTLTAPLEYLSLVHLEKESALIMTDSGGIQEEATALGKHAVVLRQVTERPEGVAAGYLHLAGTDTDAIFESVRSLIDSEGYKAMPEGSNPYGDGHAAEKIVEALRHHSSQKLAEA